MTVLLLDLEKKMFEIYMVLFLGALPQGPIGGHGYHLDTFESPAPKDGSCQVLLKSEIAFQEEDENVKSLRTDENGWQ